MSRYADLAERYEEAGLDVISHDARAGRIDFEHGSVDMNLGIGRSLGRLALEHGLAITSFEWDNSAAPDPEAEFLDVVTVWFDRIDVRSETRTVEVEEEVGIIEHDRGSAVIDPCR